MLLGDRSIGICKGKIARRRLNFLRSDLGRTPTRTGGECRGEFFSESGGAGGSVFPKSGEVTPTRTEGEHRGEFLGCLGGSGGSAPAGWRFGSVNPSLQNNNVLDQGLFLKRTFLLLLLNVVADGCSFDGPEKRS